MHESCIICHDSAVVSQSVYIITVECNALSGVTVRRYSGVRSGMAHDRDPHPEVPEEPARLADAERRPVRMSMRPPARFTAGTDLELWLTRFELYARGSAIPEADWKAELLPLLDDEAFRMVNQLGLVQAGSYDDVKTHLKTQFAPEGDVLEWQHRLQSRVQKTGETLPEFAGTLRMLVDRAFPGWAQEQKQALVRNQFIQGIKSASVQLQLMRDRPETPDAALQLAVRHETVEAAQKRLRAERQQAGSLAVSSADIVDPTQDVAGALTVKRDDRKVAELAEQVRRLTNEVVALKDERSSRRRPGVQRWQSTSNSSGPVCWTCGERGHLRRVCPLRRRPQSGNRYTQQPLNGRQPADRVVRRL